MNDFTWSDGCRAPGSRLMVGKLQATTVRGAQLIALRWVTLATVAQRCQEKDSDQIETVKMMMTAKSHSKGRDD